MVILCLFSCSDEVEVLVFRAKHWDCRSRAGLIESKTLCQGAKLMGLY